LGQAAAYKPWLTVQDVPSNGRSHRPHGLKTGRVHHLLSDIERDLFYLFDWSGPVSDIREQFPLDRKVTQRIAEELGIKHSRDRKSQAPLVMTTDFLVDSFRQGKLVRLARAVKPAEKLGDERVIQKLEIERRYWIEEGVDWGIVTERDIPKIVVRNIEWVHGCASVEDLAQPYPGYFAEKAALIAREVPAARADLKLGEFCAEKDSRFAMLASTSLMLIRHLLATKVLICEMSEPLDDAAPMARFQLIRIGLARASG
jgi:hypothetical protein